MFCAVVEHMEKVSFPRLEKNPAEILVDLQGKLKATDILTGEDVDITRPAGIADMQMGRIIRVRRQHSNEYEETKDVDESRQHHMACR